MNQICFDNKIEKRYFKLNILLKIEVYAILSVLLCIWFCLPFTDNAYMQIINIAVVLFIFMLSNPIIRLASNFTNLPELKKAMRKCNSAINKIYKHLHDAGVKDEIIANVVQKYSDCLYVIHKHGYWRPEYFSEYAKSDLDRVCNILLLMTLCAESPANEIIDNVNKATECLMCVKDKNTNVLFSNYLKEINRISFKGLDTVTEILDSVCNIFPSVIDIFTCI